MRHRAGLKRFAYPSNPPPLGMSDAAATPWTRTDISEFPEEAGALDFDRLLKRTEDQLAPGQQYRLAWPDPACRADDPRADSPAPPQAPDLARPAPWPAIGNRTSADFRALTIEQTTAQARSPGEVSGQRSVLSQPPRPAKKRRTYPTKADWKTMDQQDTESE